ncbi:MAG: peptide chain release factor N(5)-glutamine methyltransferase [Treponema sp.]|nr:peptide chain release factor N(5)-glutamine methyltransferase [Treponema sp.]
MKNCTQDSSWKILLRVRAPSIERVIEVSLTIREALAEGSAALAASGVDTPGLDASLLLAEALHTGRSSLLTGASDPLPGEALAAYKGFLERRRAGECAAYILGRKEFWGLDFTVGPAVLVPRPDTETLVEAALEWIDALSGACSRPPEVLDMCTGSGAVAVALKHERPHTAIWATDLSPEALDIAALNAQRLLEGRPAPAVALLQGDLFDALLRLPEPARFDIITANPPYVPGGIIETLPAEVRGEPRLALDGGLDGLDVIRRIISGGRRHLRDGGVLLMEAGPEQMEVIAGLLESGGYREIGVYRDMAARPRVIGAKAAG